MSNASKAAEDLKSFAKKMLPIFEVAKALEDIGSLENAASEAKARKEAAYKEADQALLSLGVKKDELDSMASKIEAAKEKAFNIMKSANAQADLMIKEAKEKALQVDAMAQDDLKKVEQAVKVLKAEIRALEAEKVSAQGNLTAIRLQLAETKDKVLSLSNG